MATVEGRPLGLDAYSKHILIAAVAQHGVMAVNTRTGRSWVLTDRLDGNLIFFPDALSVAADGTIYFSEASTVYYPGFPNDFLDGRAHGRLLRYEPATGTTRVVADDLYFANGVQVAPDESYALVAESFRTRLTRVWLRGARAGTTEQFGSWLINAPDRHPYGRQGASLDRGERPARRHAGCGGVERRRPSRSPPCRRISRARSAGRTGSPRCSTAAAGRSSASTTRPDGSSRSARCCRTTGPSRSAR